MFGADFLRGFAVCLLCILVLAMLCVFAPASGVVAVDVCGSVYHVVDGDTFDAFPVGRVRLADINAPELNTQMGLDARNALMGLIERYGPLIYLDVDDVYVMDRYYRVVAVAYLRFNETHLLNVNNWLVENGYAEVWDHRNEFDPSAWRLYLYYPEDPCGGVKVVASTMILTVTETSTITQIVTSIATVTETITSTETVLVQREDAASRDAVTGALLLLVFIVLIILIAGVIARGPRRSGYARRR